jgi:hypothetical protein
MALQGVVREGVCLSDQGVGSLQSGSGSLHVGQDET